MARLRQACLAWTCFRNASMAHCAAIRHTVLCCSTSAAPSSTVTATVCVQTLYSSDVSSLLQHWTLDAMQSVAAAGHRLHFSTDLLTAVEAAMIRVAQDLNRASLPGCLSWALTMGYTLLQKAVARMIAGAGTHVDLVASFPDDRLMVVVQALQAHVAELKDQNSDLKDQVSDLTETG